MADGGISLQSLAARCRNKRSVLYATLSQCNENSQANGNQ